MRPRVSILIQAFNAASTISLALASVMAQTFEDWECVIVDDGSQDDTARIASSLNDPRIRVIRFPENRGRPAAGARAIDEAQGEYLCILDADDWMYPDRVRKQVEALDATREAAMVSAGMAIVDLDNRLVGVRGFGRGTEVGLSKVYNRPNLPPFGHAPSMLRRSVVGTVRHDPRLKLSQDVDFLIRLLLGRRYYLMPDILYVYAEHASASADKLLSSHRNTRVIHRKYLLRYPTTAARNWLTSLGKTAAYRGLFALGLEHQILKARSMRPSSEQALEFERARSIVLGALSRYFG